MKYLTLLIPIIFLTGCWPFCDPEVQIKYVYKPKKVLVPVPCEVPKTSCLITEEMTRVEVVDEMYRCIKQHKENEKVCQKQGD